MNRFNALLFIGLLVTNVFTLGGKVNASTISSVDDALSSKSSTYDLLLSRIENELGCGIYKESNDKLCISSIRHFPGKPEVLVTVTFSESSEYLLKYYKTNTPTNHTDKLKKIAKSTAEKLGIIPSPNTDGKLWYGALQDLNLEIDGLDNKAFIKSFVRNITLQIFVKDKESVFLIHLTNGDNIIIRSFPRKI
ncbi:hypothetical protein [Sedimenticola selenatireducens]|uniref:Uncharacterized protein n=1 Tax=Sedimenticola selenatireducens TaxID=191960 RepID=A0A557SHK6_9GAMM|nr:hypothetical protein [Sedimenticola selenatireducens]TVO76880.1 hypothetical protein FHP88_05490 [Sedimenticola selenatireducens]TVT64323.1 MAG: hypothetical protein FHK78_08735 [Sedimenticola selenatireducens]